MFLLLFILTLIQQNIISDAASSTIFPIGGLFNTDESSEAFDNILKIKDSYHGRRFSSLATDSYSTALEVCANTSDDRPIVSLVDSRLMNGMCDTTCLLCSRLNIPHLSTDWEIPDVILEDSFTLYYYPPAELMSKAYASLITSLQWHKFSILYEDEGSFNRLQDIINSWLYNNDPILYRKLDPDGDNREIFKHVFKVERMSYHVIDCDINNVEKYMREIVQVENSTQYLSFILTAVDAYMLDLRGIPEMMANVSTLHLTTGNDVRWNDILDNSNGNVRLETALVGDALNHLEKAIKTMQLSWGDSQPTLHVPPALCFSDLKENYQQQAWSLGNELKQALLQTEIKGFTGNIKFDPSGKRTDFSMHYSKLNKDSTFIYVGSWNSTTGTIVTKKDVSDRSSASRSNTHLKIVTKRGKPYYDVDTSNGTVIERGYAVDLVDKIVEWANKNQKSRLTYEFYIAPGDKYGNPIEGSRKWDGIIGELMEHNADMAICDITINSERNAVVDFSLPFMTLGISMLFKEPDPEIPDEFSFIKPFGLDVWLYLAVTYIIVSFVLLICARMCQGDWVNPHPCNQNPENVENIWSLYNCMWLTMGAIMTQGCDILPRSAGSRWITGMWWFFALIVTSSYTANLSTFLSNSRRSTDIDNVKELSEQNQVSYGAVYNASTYKFFMTSNESVYQKIWSVMSSARPTVFTTNNEEGKKRVKKSKGKFAFFMESTAIEYYMQRDCELRMVGPKLDSKEYGIALPKNSPHKNMVDAAILSLQERAELDALKRKWWEEEDNNKNCDEENQSDEDDSGSVQMKNTSGIFLVLGFGGVLGLIVAVLDFMHNSWKISVKEKVLFKEAMASEWRASFNPRNLQKPVAPSRSVPPSTGTNTPQRERSQSRAVSVLRAATSFINFDETY